MPNRTSLSDRAFRVRPARRFVGLDLLGRQGTGGVVDPDEEDGVTLAGPGSHRGRRGGDVNPADLDIAVHGDPGPGPGDWGVAERADEWVVGQSTNPSPLAGFTRA